MLDGRMDRLRRRAKQRISSRSLRIESLEDRRLLAYVVDVGEDAVFTACNKHYTETDVDWPAVSDARASSGGNTISVGGDGFEYFGLAEAGVSFEVVGESGGFAYVSMVIAGYTASADVEKGYCPSKKENDCKLDVMAHVILDRDSQSGSGGHSFELFDKSLKSGSKRYHGGRRSFEAGVWLEPGFTPFIIAKIQTYQTNRDLFDWATHTYDSDLRSSKSSLVLVVDSVRVQWARPSTGSEPNQRPIADFTYSPGYVPLGDAATFDATNSRDPDGYISNYAWDFGDGSTASRAKPSHSYATPGEYPVTLTVTDNKGWTDTVQHVVTVGEIWLDRLQAFDDVRLLGDDDPTIWTRATHDDEGDLIVDGIKDLLFDRWPTRGWFEIKAKINKPDPEPTWEPRVEYSWKLLDGNGAEIGKNGEGTETGWDIAFKVHRMPNTVGQYKVVLSFDFFDEDGKKLGSQSVTHPFYATYAESTLRPKEAWVEKATEWATGAVSPITTVHYLAMGIWENSGWDYNPGIRDGPNRGRWIGLVEGRLSSGQCATFANAWNNLSGVLGVPGTYVAPRYEGKNGYGFVTTTSMFSLDKGLDSGNVHPPGQTYNDRWYFYNHVVGEYKGKFYDPTFGEAGFTPIDKYVEWNVTTEDDGTRLRRLEDGYWLDVVSDTYFRLAPVMARDLGATRGSSLVGAATFSGNYDVHRTDPDGDGIYNTSSLDIEIDVATPGEYAVHGALKNGDQVVATRDSIYSTVASPVSFTVTQSGTSVVTIDYSGEEIFQSGFDGAFVADLSISDSNGNTVDEHQFTTPQYAHGEFGEVPLHLGEVTATGQDSDENGLFELLNATVQLDVRHSGDYELETHLYSLDGELLERTRETRLLAADATEVNLEIDGTRISASQVDGPYSLAVVILDSTGFQLAYAEIETDAYLSSDFAGPSGGPDSLHDWGSF